MGKRAAWFALCCAASWTAASGRAASAARELEQVRAWKLVQTASEKSPAGGNVLKLLGWYLRSFPDGARAPDARFALAEALSRAGRRPEALTQYRRLADAGGPYAEDARLRTGELLYGLGDVPGAREAFRVLAKKASSRSALSAEAMYGLALCEMRGGDYVRANRLLERIVSRAPAYRELGKVRELAGILRYEEKNYAEALKALEGLKTASAAFYRGLSLLRLKRYPEAADAFQRMEAPAGGPHAEMGAYLKAECFRLAANDPLAAVAYGQFARLFPASRLKAYALLHRARAELRLAGPEGPPAAGSGRPGAGAARLRDATRAVEEALGMDVPKDLRVWALHLGAEIATRRRDDRRVARMLNEAAGLVEKEHAELYSSVHLAKAYYLLAAGRRAEGAEALRGFLRELPHHPSGALAYLLLGNEALKGGELNEAVSAYQAALMNYPYSALSDAAMAMMFFAFHRQGKHQELVTSAERTMKLLDSEFSTQDREWKSYSHLILGEAYYRLGSYAEASSHYAAAARNQAAAPLALQHLAWSRYHEGRHAEAVRLAEGLLGLGPRSGVDVAGAHFLLAACRFNEGEYGAAVAAFRGLRKLFPRDLRAPESLLQEGWASRQAGDVPGALRAFDELAARHPGHPLAPEAQLLAGGLHFQTGRHAAATRAFERFLARWPGSPSAAEARWLLAQSFYNARRHEAAIGAYELFLKLHPAHARAQDAEAQLQQARYRRAVDSGDPRRFSEFVRLYPKSELASEAQYQLAQILYRSKRWDEAIAEYRRLLLDYPGATQAPLALMAIAHVQDRLGALEEAVKEYRSLLSLFPAGPLAADAAMRAGAIFFSRGRYKEAAESFRFVTEREATAEAKAAALYNLGAAWKEAQESPEALKAFTEFVRAYPEHPKRAQAWLALAELHRASERHAEAALAYQEALKHPRLDAAGRLEAYYQLGEAFQKSGQKESAMGSYRSLAALGPRFAPTRLLGLAQLAALFEERGEWKKALDVYGDIRGSGGRPDWVRAASKRMAEIRAHLDVKPEMAGGSHGIH